MNVLVEGITRKIYIVDGHTSSQKIRMDQVNTMSPERSLSETAFLRYGFHYVNVLVEGITRKIYIVDGHTSSQKIRMDQVNTMRPERSLSETAFLRYGFH